LPAPAYLYSQAKESQQAGRYADALNAFRSLIAEQPENAQLQFDLGNTYNALAKPREALACYLKALSLDAELPGLRNNLGITWLDLGEPLKALECFENILAKHPNNANALNNRGTALRDLKQPKSALASYEAALQVAPNHVEALNNHGNQLLELNQPERALRSYQLAYQLAPQFPVTFRNAARSLLSLHRPQEALDLLEVALKGHRHDAFAWMYKGDALRILQRFEAAIAAYDQALSLHPQLDFLPGLKLYLEMQICNWKHWADKIALLKAAVLSDQRYTVPMPMLGLIDDPALQYRAARIYMQNNAPAQARLVASRPDLMRTKATPNHKIRIAYVSAHFHEHPSGRLMAEIFERHDRNRFEIFALSLGFPAIDAIRTRLAASVDRFIDIASQSDEQSIHLARELKIDIAVDLTGYYDQSRPNLFANRLAPIQVSYLITPGTLGMDYWDYLIADRIVVPEEHYEHFAEKIVQLPGSYFTFDSGQQISTKIYSRQELQLPQNSFVFCCFNSSYKITPETFDIWMRVLNQVPGSVLWLFESNPTSPINLRNEARARGIDPGRLIFSKVAKIEEHLARQQQADLFLDTWPCNAHTTACDALFSGVPVLTYLGKSFASRVAASMLTALDLTELIADTPQDYEAKAVALARDPGQIADLRSRLQNQRTSSSLFQGKVKAKELEAAYSAMMARHLQDLPPMHFQVALNDGANFYTTLSS
jgi:predicted O-linked N-acetylglucosamine transferase (SPINDLY family)